MCDTIFFDHPEHYRNLCGPGHGHLTIIEERLGVILDAPGGQITISCKDAEPDARAAAASVLQGLYDQLLSGGSVGAAEVEAALRFQAEASTLPKPAGAVMPASGVIVVARGRQVRGRTPRQGHYIQVLQDPNVGLSFGVGPAGTGKTYLAVAHAVSLLMAHKIRRIIITRPAVEAGERLGYLPGDLKEKVDPYMLPIWDALRDTMGEEKVAKKREADEIEVAPLAFMRGRTLRDAFVIVDEAQNATASQMQMVLTRMGENTRVAVTGDPSQRDLPDGTQSGLDHALGVLEGLKGVQVVRFLAEDVVRHPLVARIVRAYEADAATQAKQKLARKDKRA